MKAPSFFRTALTLAAFVAAAGALQAQQRPATPPRAGDTTRAQRPGIQHAQHQGVACSSCHSSRQRHGEVIVRTQADCQTCHHAGPQRQNCSQCHRAAQLRRVQPTPRTFQLTASRTPVTISMRFDHQPHAALPCVRCHGEERTRAANQADCAACHAQHHGPSATCSNCHAGTTAITKHTRNDHPNCATAACHGQAAASLPWSRETCLVCHTTQRAHMAGRLCLNCHPVRGTS